jgi:gliding motility-associated protein GldL
MMSITEFVQSPGYKKAMAYVYGFGAAVAIVGALFKIMHFPGAGVMLIAGLGVEALIFALSSFEPPHETPDWSLVYPELIGLDPDEDGVGGHGGHGGHGGGRSKGVNNAVGGGSELSALVSAGAIEQKTIDELSEGVKKLASTTSQMADISGAATATKEYISNVKSASDQLTQFSAVQTSAVELGGKFAENCAKLNNSIASQADQSEQLSKNIGAVNAAYQTQLQGINSQIKSTETLVNGLSSISAEIVASVEGVKEYRAQVANLSKTVGELNSIYGNMLSAVTNR